MSTTFLVGPSTSSAAEPVPELDILSLPDTILLAIFAKAAQGNAQELCEYSKVSHQFYGPATDRSLWGPLLKAAFPHFVPVDPENPKAEFASRRTHLSEHLRNKVYATKRITLPAGQDGGITSLTRLGNVLFTGSHRGAIVALNLLTGESRSFVGSEHGVSSLLVRDNMLYAGSPRGDIKIFDLKTGDSLATLEEGLPELFSAVEFIDIVGDKLFASNRGNVVRIWDLGSKTFVATPGLVKGAVSCVDVANGVIYAGDPAWDPKIRVFDIYTGQCKKVFERDNGHQMAIHAIALDGQTLITGSLDGVIKLWDRNSGKCLDTFEGHTQLIQSLFVSGGILYSRSIDREIRVWDLYNRTLISTIKEFAGAPTNYPQFSFDAGIVCSTRYRRDAETGQFLNTITIRDFNASDKRVFQELARLFRGASVADRKEALDRFDAMPEPSQSAIFTIMEKFNLMAPGCKEKIFSSQVSHRFDPSIPYLTGGHAFFNEHGLRATFEQRAEAVERYLQSLN